MNPLFLLPRRAVQALRADPTLAVLLAALMPLAAVSPLPWPAIPSLVDGATVAALTGLLMLTRGVEASGGLRWLGQALVARMPTERHAAFVLVLAAAALSTLLTNDVALFVVVPLTLELGRLAPLPVARLVVFEALAVNAGSMLTPIGNPQNLFLWQRAGVSFGAFVAQMAPLVLGLMAALLLLTAVAFERRKLALPVSVEPVRADRRLLGLSLALYGPFLLLTDLHHAGWAMGAVAVALLVVRPRVLAGLDWALLAVFVLMFIDLRLLAGLPAVQAWMAAQPLQEGPVLFRWGVLAAQVISNVPATIALAEFSGDWRTLAWAVNIGGFGLAVGSLANLIALRLAGPYRAGWLLHAWSVPFLVLAAGAGHVALFGLKY